MAMDNTPLLADVIPAYETFMSNWESLADARPHLEPIIQKGLDRATKYYILMDETDRYILSMCTLTLSFSSWKLAHSQLRIVLHPKFRMHHIQDNWEEHYVEKAVITIKKKVRFKVAKSSVLKLLYLDGEVYDTPGACSTCGWDFSSSFRGTYSSGRSEGRYGCGGRYLC